MYCIIENLRTPEISPSKRKKQFLYLMDLFLTNVENFPSDSTLVGHALHACKLLLDTDQEFRKQCADAIDVDERVAFKLEDNEKLQTKLLEHALPAIARQINDAYVPGKIGADPVSLLGNPNPSYDQNAKGLLFFPAGWRPRRRREDDEQKLVFFCLPQYEYN